MEELTPVEVSEQPWIDPWDGLLSGTYRLRVPNQPPDTDDHLVVYLRGIAGDSAREYRAPTTICGLSLEGAARPDRVTSACSACMDGVPRAFEQARAALVTRVETLE